jgi:ketosteroid isomerase-like protein
MSQENVEVVRRTFEIAEEGTRRGDPGAAFDEAVVQGLITSNLEFRGGTRGGTGVAGLDDVVGREGYVEFVARWIEDFDDHATEYEQIVDAGNDRVVAITRMRATGKGSRVPVEMRTGMLFTLEARCIVQVTLFIEPDKALEAAGLRE